MERSKTAFRFHFGINVLGYAERLTGGFSQRIDITWSSGLCEVYENIGEATRLSGFLNVLVSDKSGSGGEIYIALPPDKRVVGRTLRFQECQRCCDGG